MKRSGFKPRKTPLARGSWSRKSSPLPEGTKPARKTAIKSRVKRPTVAGGSKYLVACRGEPCFLNVRDICCWNWETVIPAHSNQSRHGKGMGIKAEHRYTIPCCFTCHAWLDTGPASRCVNESMFNAALVAWEPIRARKMGLEQTELEEA